MGNYTEEDSIKKHDDEFVTRLALEVLNDRKDLNSAIETAIEYGRKNPDPK